MFVTAPEAAFLAPLFLVRSMLGFIVRPRFIRISRLDWDMTLEWWYAVTTFGTVSFFRRGFVLLLSLDFAPEGFLGY